MFFATSFFSLSLSIGKRSNLAKIWGEGGAAASPHNPPGFYGPGNKTQTSINIARPL